MTSFGEGAALVEIGPTQPDTIAPFQSPGPPTPSHFVARASSLCGLGYKGSLPADLLQNKLIALA